MVVVAVRDDGYEIDDDRDRLSKHTNVLVENLSKKSWLVGVERERILARLPFSWTFGLYAPATGGGGGGGGGGGELAGFLRLVTDRISFYYVSDVFIMESLRGRGLGTFLLKTAIGQPGVADTAHGFLFTGSARTERMYVNVLQFKTIHKERKTFADGTPRTMYSMLRAPKPLDRTASNERTASGRAERRHVLTATISIVFSIVAVDVIRSVTKKK